MMSTACIREGTSQTTLESLFKHHQVFNKHIASLMNRAAKSWENCCTRFNLMDMATPQETRLSTNHAAKDKQMRRAAILFSERRWAALINRANGGIKAAMRLSQPQQRSLVNKAIGECNEQSVWFFEHSRRSTYEHSKSKKLSLNRFSPCSLMILTILSHQKVNAMMTVAKKRMLITMPIVNTSNLMTKVKFWTLLYLL